MKNHNPVSRKCEKCMRVFSKVEHLRRHQRSHTGERPHKCRTCGRTYARSDVLTRHVRNHHPLANPMNTETNKRDSTRGNDGITIQGNDRNVSQGKELNAATSVCVDFVDDRTHDRHDLPPPLDPSLTEGLRESPHNPAIANYPPPAFSHSWTAPSFAAMPLDVGDEVSPSTHPPSNDFDSVIDASLGFDSLVALPFNFSNNTEVCDSAILEDLFQEILSTGNQTRPSGRKRSISYEQLEQVRRLWPTRRRSQAPNDPGIIWDDIILHDKDNLFSSGSLDTPPDLEDPTPLNSTWGLTKECRTRLLNDCVNHYVYSPLNPSLINGFRQSVDLPEVDILDLCLDLYFYNLHPLLPFIHAPTFDASKTPTMLLFPMCLLGFMMFNRPAAQVVLNRYLLGAMSQCRAKAVSYRLRQCVAPDLFLVLGAGILLLFVASSVAEVAFEEQRHKLYEEIILLARHQKLFHSRRYHPTILQSLSDDSQSWKAWNRVQSAERLIATLVLSDSYSSHMLGVTPVLDPESIHNPFLSVDALFEARTVEKWKQKLAGQDPWDPSHALRPDVRSPSIETSSFSVVIALAKVWLRISARSQLLRGSCHAEAPESSSVTLVDIAGHDEGARVATHELLLAYDTFRSEFQHGNTNSVVMWNLLGLCMTCNLYTIELAAGRHGPAVAQEALEAVTTWAQTATARRACLHAAQIFIILHNQKRSDGIMLHSEMALFTAALVMGFYALVAPNVTAASNANERSSSSSVVDLLEEMDWTQIGSEGLGLQTGPTPLPILANPAVEFIRNGGPISFAGVQYSDSYGLARRIFMYYGAQLSEVGRWNIEEYCHVLKIIGDTTIPAPYPQEQTVS